MTKLYLIYGIIIVMIVGYLLWNEKAKAPTDTDQSAVINTSDYAEEVNQNKKTENNMDNLSFPGVLEATKIENKKVVMQTSKGVIEFELYADRAPKSVSNFVYLAEQGYYDDLTFHRVVPSFVIQGGDPYATGSGGPGYKFEDEEVIGDYKAGTVAMANSGPNTNGSQFFICIKDQPDLPKNYNLFGQVTLGLDVVSKISVGDIMTKVTIAEK